MVVYMQDTGEDEPIVLLSGGNAKLLEERLATHVIHVENLVLEGLVLIGAEDV